MDLHVHTCLSPCADDRMVPSRIITQAKKARLDVLGISDHNSSRNVPAVAEVGRKEGITVFGGMEITSKEEIHVLAFFADHESLMKMQDLIDRNLPGKNDPESLGEQWIVDSWDALAGVDDRLLLGATGLSIERIIDTVHRFHGIAVASHVDRPAFSITSQLGFIPPDLPLDAVEVSRRADWTEAEFQECGYPLVRFSDAHFLEDIGVATTDFLLEEPTLGELKKALMCSENREIRLS
ncbi:MAG TPA: PHP domain-containing protein [Spirochaetia bacterium]|nr:PHP domain-containing protein [Spirochaetia bacterium]